jgi:L-aminoadipate-semialdehyde dehydrogenase
MLKKAGKIDPEVRAYINKELSLHCEIPALQLLDNGVLVGGSIADDGTDCLDGTTANDNTAVRPVGIDSIGTLSFTSGSTGVPKGQYK